MADAESRDENTYLFDAESAAEMGRLILQDRLLNEAMGGLFPERTEAEIQKIRAVLDLGCGPGGWALSVAQRYPHIEVIGIDISELMIAYSRAQARRENLSNACFELMNVLKRLLFPDNIFDVVNMRAAMSFIPRMAWPAVIKECWRVARPGGCVRLTEFDSPGLTNSPAFEAGLKVAAHLSHLHGLGFSPEGGQTMGITFMPGKFLADAGCCAIRYAPHVVDFSYGTPLHAVQVLNVNIATAQSSARMKKSGIMTTPEEELQRRRAVAQTLAEMQDEGFRALQYWLTAWGEKEASDG